jgi:hypothetical protein
MNAPLQAAALLCLALAMHPVHAQSARSDATAFPKNLATAELKRVFLVCDLASSRARLALHDAAQCSMVYEELKQRAFDGDYEKLLAWWRAQRSHPQNQTANSAAP